MKLAKRNIRAAADEKLSRTHSKLVDQLVEQYRAYERSRGECLRLAVEINNTGLWRKTHISFADFLMDSLGIKKSQAYRLIEAAEIVDAKEKSGEQPPTTEREARAQISASKNGSETTETKCNRNGYNDSPGGGMENSVKSGSKPTLKPQKTEKEVLYDSIGIPVPDEAIPFWKRRDEVQALLGKISDIKCAVERAKSAGDALYGGVSNNFVVEMRSAYAHIKDGAMPYAVCTQCMGTPSLQPDGCSFCKNTGLIPEWRWNTQSIKEVKEMRIKIAADLAAQSK